MLGGNYFMLVLSAILVLIMAGAWIATARMRRKAIHETGEDPLRSSE